MQKLLLLKDINQIEEYMESETFNYISCLQTHTFESFKNFNIFGFDWYDVHSEATDTSKVLIYIDVDDLFIICSDEKLLFHLKTVFQIEKTNEKALYHFFANLIKNDMTYFESFEKEITDAEDMALSASRKEDLNKVISFHKELLRLKKYYEQLDIILDNLAANDNEIMSNEGERLMNIISNRVHRYQSNVLNLRDYVTQMREAYQAQIDIEQNELMKVFTIITSIFLPLTLIVGWYGMNFQNMPELTWKYGYLSVIIFSIIVSIFMIAFFKRKKWF
ncbi:MAG: magnesium transporter CorA family protein [Proteocatella sp.]